MPVSITLSYNDYIITTDKALMQVEKVHAWLSTHAYWCQNIPFGLVQQAFEHSYCIGALHEGGQIAYARLITDYTTFGYLADVYVAEEHRGKGISKKMMETLFGIDWVRGLRRILLATTDAHGLYNQCGFNTLAHPERMMEIVRPAIYQPPANEHAHITNQ